jgi:hypothetical protein
MEESNHFATAVRKNLKSHLLLIMPMPEIYSEDGHRRVRQKELYITE